MCLHLSMWSQWVGVWGWMEDEWVGNTGVAGMLADRTPNHSILLKILSKTTTIFMSELYQNVHQNAVRTPCMVSHTPVRTSCMVSQDPVRTPCMVSQAPVRTSCMVSHTPVRTPCMVSQAPFRTPCIVSHAYQNPLYGQSYLSESPVWSVTPIRIPWYG